MMSARRHGTLIALPSRPTRYKKRFTCVMERRASRRRHGARRALPTAPQTPRSGRGAVFLKFYDYRTWSTMRLDRIAPCSHLMVLGHDLLRKVCSFSGSCSMTNQERSMVPYSAIVAGATGVVGRGLTEALASDRDWEVVALARKPLDIKGARFLSVDLTSADEARRMLGGLSGTTHIFYAARFDHFDGQPEPIDVNLAMLRHLVEAVEPRAPRLQHIHLLEGTKWYGSHLGPFPTPA